MTDDAPAAARGAATAVDKMADAIRGRVDLFGKALAAIATLGTGAVGLTKVAELAGWNPGEGVWVMAAVGCLLVAAVSALVIAVRLMGVNAPVVLTPAVDPSTLGGARDDVQSIFDESAQRFGFSRLLALDEHAMSLRRVAARATSDDQRARRTARAKDVQDEIDRALARARLAVIRHHAVAVVSDARAWLCYVGVLLGLMGFALAADYVTSEPQASLSLARDCATASSAGPIPADVVTQCPAPSASDTSTPSTPPGSREQQAALIREISALLERCEMSAATPGPDGTSGLSTGDCGALRRVIQDLATP